jgi:hypothetical protein
VVPLTFTTNIKFESHPNNKTKPITIPTKVLIVKHNTAFSDYILLGNDWFYGQNNDRDQMYLAEIVTDAEDVWVRTMLCIKDLIRGEKRAVIQVERAYDFWDSESFASIESSDLSSDDSSNKYTASFVKLPHKWCYCTVKRQSSVKMLAVIDLLMP